MARGMTERQRFYANEQKRRLLALSGYTCERCGGPGWQLAHRIPNTVANIRKYGPEVIHHEFNLAVTCDQCNQLVIVHGTEEDRLVQAIQEDLWERN